jgi:hypothetical protein
MTLLSWNDVQDRNERLEFGACQVFEAWRRHKTSQHKFLGLESAFKSSSHRLPLLLQSVGGNYNARNHRERGQAIFAAVWFSTSPWAILGRPTHATLVERALVERIPTQKERLDETSDQLRRMFSSSPVYLQVPLDESFYDMHIQTG